LEAFIGSDSCGREYGRLVAVAVLTVLKLSGCGGGSTTAPPPWPPTPTITSFSAQADGISTFGQACVWLVVLLSSVSVIWSWRIWYRQMATAPTSSKVRGRIEFSGLVAGTVSALLYAAFVLAFLFVSTHKETFSLIDTDRDCWIYAGLGMAGVALVLSSFGSGKARIAGMTMGTVMFLLWALVLYLANISQSIDITI
jgi:hypothetical protein